MRQQALAGGAAIAGAVAFTVIVAGLQAAQSAYDPSEQLMSELALGPHGRFMLGAFVALTVALAALALGLPARQRWARAALLVSALCFLAAGIFPLGAATEAHVSAVALGFVSAGLAMYLLPAAPPFQGARWRIASWGLLAVMGAAAALAHSALPIGLGQRLAAAALLGWLGLCGGRLLRR
jgi:hypothetical membrane protein